MQVTAFSAYLAVTDWQTGFLTLDVCLCVANFGCRMRVSLQDIRLYQIAMGSVSSIPV